MYTAAPRLDPRLLRLIAELDDPSNPMAETYRQARKTAAQLGIPRPSYGAGTHPSQGVAGESCGSPEATRDPDGRRHVPAARRGSIRAPRV